MAAAGRTLLVIAGHFMQIPDTGPAAEAMRTIRVREPQEAFALDYVGFTAQYWRLWRRIIRAAGNAVPPEAPLPTGAAEQCGEKAACKIDFSGE